MRSRAIPDREPILRVGLALGIAIAGLAGGTTTALAAERSDGIVCQFDEHILRVDINVSGATATIYRTPAGAIRVNEHVCAWEFQPADVWNTRRINVFGGDGTQTVVLETSDGGFGPGYGYEPGVTDEIEMSILLGAGQDSLIIHGTDAGDRFGFGWVQGNMTAIPAVNLNGDTDHDVSYLSAEYVAAWGYAGDDVMTGNDPATGAIAFTNLYLHGNEGDDEMTGGNANDNLYGGKGSDVLKGGKGIDELYGEDGVGGNDQLYGGSGVDDCWADPGDVIGVNCE